MITSPLLKLLSMFQRKPEPAQPDIDYGEPIKSQDVFTTSLANRMSIEQMNARVFTVTPDKMIVTDVDGKQYAMDDGNNAYNLKGAFSLNQQRVPDGLLMWYTNQSFIGFQNCALMSQHWLVDKACAMPAEDACRNGWEAAFNDGTEIDPEMLARLKRLDIRYRVKKNLVELTKFKRVFGYRIAIFVVESDDPDYYLKPFNPDGIKPRSYRGISQVDPYWVTPELTDVSVRDPASIHFYEPEYWRIGAKKYHRSHLIVVRHAEVPDILKPSYVYGGVSLTQQIYERVYASERTANEAPQLAMTKRMNVTKVDLAKFFQNPDRAMQRMEEQAAFRDNYGTRLIDLDDEYTQHETSLADLDSVIMSQYQLVAAIADVPATKLLGTSPKGFNATGEFELQSYHETLASIQEHDMTPLLERHYEIMLRSDFGITSPVEIIWSPMDEPTEEQLANVNKTKADTYNVLQATGAIDGQDIRDVLIKDKSSGFNTLDDALPDEDYLGDDQANRD